MGMTKASSESMSHAVIYEQNPDINSVIHVHHVKMWKDYLNVLPTTDPEAQFGTPRIATEIQKLIKNKKGIIIMGGHEEGILTYGSTIEETYNLLLEYFNKI